MNNVKFVDLSGFGISGKGAYIDLFREFDKYDTPDPSFEFGLLRFKDGLIDLRFALVDSWSPVRSDVAIKRFKKLIDDIGPNPSKLNLFKSLSVSGSRYDAMFGGKFTSISNKYIDSLVDDSYSGLTVYPMQDDSLPLRLFKKILYRAGVKSVYYSKNYISTGISFDEKTKNYLSELFRCRNNKNYTTFVLYNAFEPFNCYDSIGFFDDAKSIIVDRDPRDIYLSALTHKHPNDVPKNLDVFINRFKLFRERLRNKSNQDVLCLNFEDLVLSYEETLSRIFKFLGEDKSIHTKKKKFFDPEVSKAGVGIWKNTKNIEEVDYIYTQLRKYCKDY